MMGRVFEASSVILLRPARQRMSAATSYCHDYEILMVGRSMTAKAFAKRAVFPGGKVEKADTEVRRVDVKSVKPFSFRYQVCAIRELFEETGVLLTEPQVKLSAEVSLHWRSRVLTEASAFNDMMDSLNCHASVSKLRTWSHWITPASGEHRFDTWFFVAESPNDAKATVFPGEMELVDVSWRSPRQALDAYQSRQIQLAPPQIYILEQMSTLPTIEDVLQHVPNPQDIKEYLPVIRKKDEGIFTVLLPGDKDYNDPSKDRNGCLHRVEVHSDPNLTKVYGASGRSSR